MRPEHFHARDLVRLFRTTPLATMAELKEALGTESDATVFRKLKTLSYRTSYSHSGRYYTLDEMARFDPHGLWSVRSVHFSRYGTLLSTVEAFVEQAEAGWYAVELESVLQVAVNQALVDLYRKGRIDREKIGGRFLYVSPHRKRKKQQRRMRSAQDVEASLGWLGPEPSLPPDELKAAIVLFFSLLDEKQRRLYAGLESLKFGHGGDRKVGALLGLDAGTIARGRQQLLDRDVQVDRVRKAGGGRKRVEKKRRKSLRSSKS